MSAFYFSRELMLLVCFTSQTPDGHGVNLYCFIMMTMTVTGMTMMIDHSDQNRNETDAKNSEINPTRCNNCVYSSQWLYSTCFG